MEKISLKKSQTNINHRNVFLVFLRYYRPLLEIFLKFTTQLNLANLD